MAYSHFKGKTLVGLH